ncbi:MAG TPA: CPBP family intramembrane glutamic endopeptidase [Puia sp.]|nr:CPBP family intramembrane glutamic endopeptidase [Puia sp.]
MTSSIRQNAVVGFPLVRMVIGIAICLGLGLLGMQLTQLLLQHTSLPGDIRDPIAGTVFAILVLVLYRALYQGYENREIAELSTRQLGSVLTGGILLGFTIASAVIAIQYLAHVYTIVATRSFAPVLPNLWSTFVNATIAEIIIIGIVFRLVEDWLGSYLALAILVVLFFILHITAPGATPFSAFAVSMHAAFLLAPAYLFSRKLWLPVAIHFAWDFAFAGVYGAAVNQYTLDTSVFQSQILGSDLLTGGYFGPQGSVQAAGLCLVTGFIFIRLAQRRGNIKSPLGHRPR